MKWDRNQVYQFSAKNRLSNLINAIFFVLTKEENGGKRGKDIRQEFQGFLITLITR